MELKFILEALLHTSQKPLSPTEIRDVLQRTGADEGAHEAARDLQKASLEDIEAALQALKAEHHAARRSYHLACIAGSWQFVTSPDVSPWLKTFLGVKPRPTRLSQPSLETLAIIAYRQPITRAEIEQIRGVAVDGVIATLRERNLITEAGRAEVIGRPMQYATTQAFLEYFGLAKLDELPAADELRTIPVQRPQSLLTVDPGLATAPDPALQPELPIESIEPTTPAPSESNTAQAADGPATPSTSHQETGPAF